MPLPIVAAEIGIGLGGKILKGAGKVIKGIGRGLKKMFGGGKKREAKKALRQSLKAEKKIGKFESKIAKQQSKLGQQQMRRAEAGGVLSGLLGLGAQDAVIVDDEAGFEGIPSISPADDRLTKIQQSIFKPISKDGTVEFAPYDLNESEGIQALSRGDFDVDSEFVSQGGKRKKNNMMMIIGIVLTVLFFGFIVFTMAGRKR